MNKFFSILGVVAIIGLTPAAVSAQETMDEATASIENVLAFAKKGDAAAEHEVGGW